jgi:hypothetical protein
MQQAMNADRSERVASNGSITNSVISNSVIPRLRLFSRGRLIGLAGVIVVTSLYFGTVVWFGHDLADQVKAGTREVTAGMMVPDQG